MKRTVTIASGVCLLFASASRAEERSVAEITALVDQAAVGAHVEVPAGTYNGMLRVSKAVVLDGAGRVTIDGGGAGTVVELLAPGITFRGFTVRGSDSRVDREPAGVRAVAGPVVIENNRLEDVLFGIDLKTSPGSAVRGNTVIGKPLEPGRRGDGLRLWWSHGCTVENNTVRQARDMVFWYSEDLTIRDNDVAGCRYGLHFMYSHHTVLERNVLTGNSVGIYLMYSNGITLTGNRMTGNRGASGYGIGLKDCDDIVVTGNALLSNRVGAYIDNSPSSVDSIGLVEANMIAFNEIGVLATPNTHDNVFTGNALIENEQQAATHGRGRLTNNTFSRDGVGNFWSDYAGFDRDGDGIGDLPYEPRSLFGAMLAREPNLRLFVHSPAQQAIEFTSRAMPEFRPEPTLIDPAPLTTPPEIRCTARPVVRAPGAMAAGGAGLLAVAAGGLAIFGRRESLPTRGAQG